MKRNSSLAKILLAAVFFQTNIAVAENYGKQTNSEVNAAAELQPLVCQKVPSPYWNPAMSETAPLVDDPKCVAENNRRARVRASAAAVQQQTARSSTGDGTELVAPKAPAFNCGSMDVHSTEYYSCKSTYDAANKQYQKDLAVYNQAQNAAGDKQKADELKAMEDQKSKSAAETLEEIKQKNDKGKKSFDITAAITMGLGVAATVKGTACASSCPTGCCSAAPAFFITAAAMFLLNSKSKKQSAQHAASSANACKSLNQLSSTQTSCDSSSAPGSTTTISYDPVTGKCLPEGSEACAANPSIGVAAPNVKDALTKSGFASGKSINDPFTLLDDGSIKLKNGKVYKESDFKDANSLMALGMSAGAANDLLKSMGSNGGDSLAKVGAADLKSKEKVYRENLGGAFGDSGGGTTVVDSSGGVTSDKKFTDPLEAAKGDGKEFSDDRKPSSEGLAKEFNGELIGVAGDDIFLMMNRRYKLKSEQDSFIAADMK